MKVTLRMTTSYTPILLTGVEEALKHLSNNIGQSDTRNYLSWWNYAQGTPSGSMHGHLGEMLDAFNIPFTFADDHLRITCATTTKPIKRVGSCPVIPLSPDLNGFGGITVRQLCHVMSVLFCSKTQAPAEPLRLPLHNPAPANV